MNQSTKLKPINRSKAISISIVAVVLLSIIAISLRILLTPETKLKVFGSIFLLFAIINFVAWLRTKNSAVFIMMFISLAMALSYLFDYKGIYFAIPMGGLAIYYFRHIYISGKYQMNYRKILELAAQQVKSTTNGFTSRPLPAGSAQFTMDGLVGFAKFMKKNHVVRPYFEENRVLFIVKDMHQIWFGAPDLKKDTYISFDFDGAMAVNIAKGDYQQFKEELTFDQLCAALGGVFRKFLHYFEIRETDKIVSSIKMKRQIYLKNV